MQTGATRILALFVAAAGFATVSGCGGETTYPVEGRIVYVGGSPADDLEGYSVTLESLDREPPVSASGEVEADGTFELSTFGGNDGVVPGRHRVAINPPPQMGDEPMPPLKIDPKYQTLDQTDLEINVESADEIVLEVEPFEPEGQG
jgi:hypothetical protein